jgi:hypothetical protein
VGLLEYLGSDLLVSFVPNRHGYRYYLTQGSRCAIQAANKAISVKIIGKGPINDSGKPVRLLVPTVLLVETCLLLVYATGAFPSTLLAVRTDTDVSIVEFERVV